jgi:4-amino-4-deoxychorismate lyase
MQNPGFLVVEGSVGVDKASVARRLVGTFGCELPREGEAENPFLATEHVSVLDRGFQYGDGLFETMKVQDGQPRHWARHLARLQLGCERLGIAMPAPAVLQAGAQQVCRGVDTAVLKITVTRGVGARGYAVSGAMTPTQVLACLPVPNYPATHWSKGVRLHLCQTRMGENPALAGIKHLNRLEQVLARMEWDDSRVAEGLLRDNENRIIEGTMSNVFCVKAGRLLTPALSRCGVRGITRDRILAAARQLAVEAEETDLYLDDLQQAQELFVSNSLIGIWPVRHFAGRDFTVGPLTLRMMAALEADVG